MYTEIPARRFRIRGSPAFTLVEMLVALGIGMAMIGVITLTTVELYKSFTGATAYRNVHKEARHALGKISRDIRSATNLVSYATSDITLNVINSTGAISSVRYYLVNNKLQRVATTGAATETETLTDNVTILNFERWTNPGTPATQNSDTYEIRAELTVTNTAAFRSMSATDLLQTRALMRNKP